MTILSIDASTKSTGVALFTEGKLVDYQCLAVTGAKLYKRIEKMIELLGEYIDKHPEIDIVYMEDVYPEDCGNNRTVFRALMHLQGFVCDLLDEKELPPAEFLVSSEWRKKCGIKTGRGRRRDTLKECSILFVKEKFNIEVNDDIADAIGIGYAAQQEEETEEVIDGFVFV